ncbi:MAG: hypothetical protein H7067_09810 [Burkholderiales bacterium]|nr:hypothetical protein [Opitutaceae bacterium]
MSDADKGAEESERLLRFLYLCPVGLADIDARGGVRMMNALAAQLLMPLARGGGLDNFFDALADIAPDLPGIVAAYPDDSGTIVRDRVLRVPLRDATRHYSLNVLRVDGDTYMASLADVTQAVLNEAIARDASQAQSVQEGRVEVLTSVLHDIGNGITGIGTRTALLGVAPAWEELEQLAKLAGFLRQRRALLEPALGADKTAALLGFVETVETRLRTRADGWRETVAFYATAIAHVQDIINIQRQFIRGGGGAARGSVSVTDLLDDALAIQRDSLLKRGVSVSLDYAPRVPPLAVDRTRLIQVFVNALKNVVEAFDALEGPPAGGVGRTLRLGVRLAPGDQLEVTFADNACGFASPDGLLPITRGETTKAGGSGLGLHASAQIIASHHGTFALRSPGPGLGSVCTILLPLRQPSESPSP